MRKTTTAQLFRALCFAAIMGALLRLAACVAPTSAATGRGLLHEVFPTATRSVAIAAEHGCPWRCAVAEVNDKDGIVIGYTVTQRLASRSGRFTAAFFVSADMRIIRTEVLTYAGERGGGVRAAHFTSQFVGKGLEAPLQVGKDIDAVTGATMSCSALADGVRHGLRLLPEIRPAGHAASSKAPSEK